MYVFIESKKPHNLLSASWRHKKASGMLQFESEAKEPGGSSLYAILRAKDELSPLKQAAGSNIGVNSSFLCFLFYLGPQRIRQTQPL